MRLDAHHHFWRIADRRGHWPPPELAPMHRDFEPADLQPALQRCGIDGTVLVQSIPSIEDTRWLLDVAEGCDFVRAVVGWADMKSSDAPERIGELAQHRKLKGLRPMLQDIDDPTWIDDIVLEPAVHAMLQHRLCFDALVQPRHLRSLLAFAHRYPALPIVIDHAAKPRNAGGELDPWRRDMHALAQLPQVTCKLSGMLTEAPILASARTLQSFADHVLASFGTHRVMWGSDWPVLGLASDYDGWWRMAHELCASHPTSDLEAVFGGNARRFYRLDEDRRKCNAWEW